MVPKQHATHFPITGSHLQRYAARYNAVEINSSFYVSHRPNTYARWRDTVPDAFRFSVKMPREVTHKRKLVNCLELIDQFLAEVEQLADKLGPLLVQLPPKLAFDQETASAFFAALRDRFQGEIAFEPRHPSWFADEQAAFLREHRLARVAADPAPVPAAALPAGTDELCYYRLHGSPDMYYSPYSDNYLQQLARVLRQSAQTAETWCIFDNTARQHATDNALWLIDSLLHPPLQHQS
jgi:uncharacterized protein YecE (DUF72 family)